MAFGVINAAIERGLKVPDDLAVVGFDDIPLSSFFVPPLTTVGIPMFSLGTSSMRALINLMSGKNQEVTVQLLHINRMAGNTLGRIY